MTLHLMKLCVGSSSLEELSNWQSGLMRRYGQCFHTTRMYPKRVDELIDGGSIYWIMGGVISVRQRLLDIERFTDADGIKRCHLILDPDLVLTRPKPHRPFQGWRYLMPEAAPSDLSVSGDTLKEIPDDMRRELVELGLI